MRILFLTDNFPPESNAPANRTYEHCQEWLKYGAEITVITCAPNFPVGKVFGGYKNKLWQEEIKDGIRVIRVWSYIAANKGVVRRTLDYISYGFTSFLASLFIKTDIIIATSPQMFTAVGGRFAALFKRKPWIMEVRDIWPESIRAVQAANDGVVYKLLEKLEYYLYKNATKIIVVTDSFKDNLIGKKVSPLKIDIVKNGVVLDNYKVCEKSLPLLQILGLENKFIVGYIGTHGLAHKLDFILDCAKKVTDKSVHFLFIGEGAERENLLLQKEALKLENVTFLRGVRKKEVAEYISIIDVSLVNLRKSDTFKTVIPSKMFENAAMGKPILLGIEGESKSIIKQYDAGICYEPENELDFLNKLTLIKKDKELYRHLQSGCLVLSKQFNRKDLALELFGIIKKMLSTPSTLDEKKYAPKNLQ